MRFETLRPNERLRIGQQEIEVLAVDAARGEVRCSLTDPTATPPYREFVLMLDDRPAQPAGRRLTRGLN